MLQSVGLTSRKLKPPNFAPGLPSHQTQGGSGRLLRVAIPKATQTETNDLLPISDRLQLNASSFRRVLPSTQLTLHGEGLEPCPPVSPRAPAQAQGHLSGESSRLLRSMQHGQASNNSSLALQLTRRRGTSLPFTIVTSTTSAEISGHVWRVCRA
eukprot:6384305-Amphidinium_carterae.1